MSIVNQFIKDKITQLKMLGPQIAEAAEAENVVIVRDGDDILLKFINSKVSKNRSKIDKIIGRPING